MNYVLIIHEVENYNNWKKGFDEATELRKSAGEIQYQVLRFQDNRNKIVHYSLWHSLEKARSFFESDKVKAIRKTLGVRDPEFIYLNELENGIL